MREIHAGGGSRPEQEANYNGADLPVEMTPNELGKINLWQAVINHIKAIEEHRARQTKAEK